MSNPVCLVTGASSGIGRQIALTFAKSGYDVILNYAQSKESAQGVALECAGYGVQTLVLGCNVADHLAVKAMIDQSIQQFGRIDVLVNNSGITKDQLLLE